MTEVEAHEGAFAKRPLQMLNDDVPESSLVPGSGSADDIAAAVLDILIDSGPDAVNFTGVSAAVGSRAEVLQAIYGHSGELLHLAWDRQLREEFTALVARARSLMEMGTAGGALMGGMSQRQRAGVHLLTVAHRFDELREVVPFDVQRILHVHDDGDSSVVDRSVFRALLGWLMGIALEPDQSHSDSLNLLEYIGWSPGCWKEHPDGGRAEVTPPLPLIFDDVGDMSQEILGACTRVIAQGGLARATLLRIARISGYPSEVLHGMYGSQEHLIAQYVQLVFALLFSYPRFEQYMSSPALATMRLDVWLGPELHTRRRALLELAMSSNFSPFLKSAFASAAEVALTNLWIAYLDRSETDVAFAHVRFVASRQLALGLALLDDIEVDSTHRDWSAFLRIFLSQPG